MCFLLRAPKTLKRGPQKGPEKVAGPQKSDQLEVGDAKIVIYAGLVAGANQKNKKAIFWPQKSYFLQKCKSRF